MIGLVDCNNFFASCERVFNPSLNGRPIVVLSNNDGCCVARSEEVNQLGVKMGVPYYQIKDLCQRENIAVFSSNYTLYGDMSSRVMSILTELVPGIDVYSIDEAFLDLTGIQDLQKIGAEVVDKTSRGSGIPVSFGAAPTRTLAKLANRLAKKYKGYNRVCIIDSDEKRIKALQKTEVGDIWGIGRQSTKKLNYFGVNTAYDLTQKSRSWVRKQLTVVGERTWLELHGEQAIESDSIESKKQICTSRSFGEMVSDFQGLYESVADFTSKCCHKLRAQNSVAQGAIVFAYTNRFREDLSQYYPSRYITFSFPTADTAEILENCKVGLAEIYKEGYLYKKAGVILTDIIPSEHRVLDLFDTKDRGKQAKLNKVVDSINNKNGYGCIRLAALGDQSAQWQLRREHLSPCPSTNINDIIRVRV